jgi:hypothetical protein
MTIKLLLAGSWRHPIYEQACADSLIKQGVEVVDFKWDSYFDGLAGRIQSKWNFRGPALSRLNRDIVKRSINSRPDVVFIWRGTHLLPETIREIKERTGAVVVAYNNDDPFSPLYSESRSLSHRNLWKMWIQSIKEYDIHFVYRPLNLKEIIAAGAKEAHLLLPYYIPDIHKSNQVGAEDRRKYECDAVFIGHFEDDGRIKYLQALVDAGLKVKLFGGKSWAKAALGGLSDFFGPIHELSGIEYAKALKTASLALCFLSKLNRDVYTRRCFEIPASGGLLLSERTSELTSMFSDGKEAVFFSSPNELVTHALNLKGNSDLREQISNAGRERVLRDGHGVDERMASLMSTISSHLRLGVV